MPTVHCKIEFSEDGIIQSVKNMKAGGHDGQNVPDTPSHGDPPHIGKATIFVKAGDDPCIVQGGKQWCW